MAVAVDSEVPLPSAVTRGSASAIFCAGVCRGARVARVELEAGGAGVTAERVRRRDGTGFWGVVPLRATGGPVDVVARVDGEAHTLGTIDVVPVSPPAPAGGTLIGICLATYEPDLTLFRTQIESLRAQTDGDWVCVVSDDGSSAESVAAIAQVIGDDPRFTLSQAPARQGFYRNFERALGMLPVEAGLVALCDQDDRWHPDKLATLRAALGEAALVYSDQRLVDARGRVLQETLWRGRRNNHSDIVSLLVANSVTGAATLFRREVAELALPFPEPPGFKFHDHWIGLVALAAGDVAYVERPLYDYVQHEGAVFGDVALGSTKSRRGNWHAAYVYGYLARSVLARTLLLRCEGRMAPAKRRALRRFLAAGRSPAACAWLLARSLRHRGTTLGSEVELVQGIAWRRLARLRPATAGIPDPRAFQQRGLRRWRASQAR